MNEKQKYKVYIIVVAINLIQSLLVEIKDQTLSSFSQNCNKITRLAARFMDTVLRKFDDKSIDMIDYNSEVLALLIDKSIEAANANKSEDFIEYINNFEL